MGHLTCSLLSLSFLSLIGERVQSCEFTNVNEFSKGLPCPSVQADRNNSMLHQISSYSSYKGHDKGDSKLVQGFTQDQGVSVAGL